MTKRFAIIDENSGWVWGVADATGPAEACRAIEKSVDSAAAYGKEHEVVYGGLDGQGGFYVHEVPAGFGDGQDREEIAKVKAFPLVACVVARQADRYADKD